MALEFMNNLSCLVHQRRCLWLRGQSMQCLSAPPDNSDCRIVAESGCGTWAACWALLALTFYCCCAPEQSQHAWLFLGCAVLLPQVQCLHSPLNTGLPLAVIYTSHQVVCASKQWLLCARQYCCSACTPFTAAI